ncbi:MAG: DUF4440 domain-containing protein [Arenibacterium sp.]
MEENDKPIATLDLMLSLETNVWQALQQGNAASDLAALSKDFIGVYPSGLSDREGHAEQLSDGPSILSYQITSPQFQIIGPGCAMLIYHARYHRVGRTNAEEMYVSSLWQWQDGTWRNRFSQDTPVPG